MSFSPTAGRRAVVINGRQARNGVSPNRRELSPARPVHNYIYNHNYNNDRRRGSSPNPPVHSRPRRQVTNNDTNVDSSKPLLEQDARNPGAPLAGPEMDDTDSDDRETVTHVQPGVDDGFFSTDDTSAGRGAGHPDAENIPEKPSNRDPEAPYYPDEPHYPETEDEPDLGRYPANHPRNYPHHPEFPYAPGYGPDVVNFPDYPATEFGSDSIPDINVYQHKKTLAQGMMDLALFSANANQLRYVLESNDRHPYYYPSIVLISFSLFFQVAVGVGLIWNARYNVKDRKEICMANRISNFTIIGIFLVTVVNVFISAFGVANAPPTVVTTTT